MSIPLADRHVTDPPLASALAELRNLEAVLGWAPTLAGIDAVQMDEYHYDTHVPLGKRATPNPRPRQPTAAHPLRDGRAQLAE